MRSPSERLIRHLKHRHKPIWQSSLPPSAVDQQTITLFLSTNFNRVSVKRCSRCHCRWQGLHVRHPFVIRVMNIHWLWKRRKRAVAADIILIVVRTVLPHLTEEIERYTRVWLSCSLKIVRPLLNEIATNFSNVVSSFTLSRNQQISLIFKVLKNVWDHNLSYDKGFWCLCDHSWGCIRLNSS